MITKTFILLCALASLATAKVTFTEDSVRLICDDNHQSIINFTQRDVRLLQEDITNVNIDYCAFPADDFRVTDFLDNLGLSNIKQLSISDPKALLKREHLAGLSLKTLQLTRAGAQLLSDDLLADVKLDYLEIFNGDLTTIPKDLAKSATHLKRLFIMGNSFKKIKRNEFSSLPQLTELQLFSNSIEEIEEGAFDDLEDLKLLDLGNNKINSLSDSIFRKLKNLERINLSKNELTELPANLFSENSKLKYFRMNIIRSITSLPAGLFKGLSNLQEVELKENGLTSLPVGIFDDAVSLKSLDLADNELDSLPENIFSNTKLKKLYLDGNKFTNIKGSLLKDLNRLTVLSIAGNSLTYIEPNLCNYLQSLEEIDVSYNQLDLNSGKMFVPSNKSISVFLTCSKLKTLNAAHNKVTQMFSDYRLLWNLKDIDLSNNEIQNLTAFSILDLYSNANLNLANNKISSIDLRGLEKYAPSSCYEGKDVNVDIRGNPVHCDCNIIDLVRYLHDEMTDDGYNCVNFISRKLKCASPPELADRNVVGLSLSELSCTSAPWAF